MAITQQNLYIPGFDISSIAKNIDYDRLGVDKSVISVDYSVSPAVVTVKKGSIIEANGDTYLIDNDEVFAMANAAHNYITFDGTTFSSAATIGTWSTIKQGYYNGTVKTLRHYINQSNENEMILIDITMNDNWMTYNKDLLKVGLTANFNTSGAWTKLPLNNTAYDILNSWDETNYEFHPSESGKYLLIVKIEGIALTAVYPYYSMRIYKNGATIINEKPSWQNGMVTGYNKTFCMMDIVSLIKTDYIDLRFYLTAGGEIIAGSEKTYIQIYRIF